MLGVWIAIRTFLGIGTSINGTLLIGVIAAAVFFGWAEIRYHQGKVKGEASVKADIIEGAQDAQNKSETEQAAAARPGAADRLRADPKTCPGCQPKAGNGKSVSIVAPSKN